MVTLKRVHVKILDYSLRDFQGINYPKKRRRDSGLPQATTETQRQCVAGVEEFVAPGATQREERLRGFLRQFWNIFLFGSPLPVELGILNTI